MMSRTEPTWPPKPLYVAVDIAVCTVIDQRLHALLWRRPYEPFEDDWALPGTFSRADETLDEAARRALAEKTGLAGVWLEQLATFDQPRRGEVPGRDPRARVISVAYLALIDEHRLDGGDPSRRRWWPIDE
ncbi:MAG TPA: NUDIX hydrolase, partial [Nitriliruptorales bacterium]